MTKTGVGTSAANTMTGQNTNTTATTTTSNGNSSSSTTTSPEIPIWVSDRKKWVTGISKKTTINDIIYAILKQCHINCEYEYINEYVLVEIMYSLTNEQQQQQQQQNFIINSERVLKGNSKVYKYINKWIENSNKLILKVKKCEIGTTAVDDTSAAAPAAAGNNNNNNLNVSLSSASSATTDNHNTSSVLDTTLTGVQQQQQQKDTNTITKFFKKLTNVNSNSNNHSNNSTSSNSSSNNKSNGLNIGGSNVKHVVRYVDVKLPQQPPQQQQQMPQSHSQMFINNTTTGGANHHHHQQQQQSTLTRVNKAGIVPIASLQKQQQQQLEYEADYDQPNIMYQQQQQQQKDLPQLPYKQYDPTLQKTLIISNILDKDKRLNQQFERVTLLDELIKEAEKTLVLNENYYLSNQHILEQQPNQQQQQHQPSLLNSRSLLHTDLNLNDVYSCFPEMCTHGTNEVEEFQLMCKKLLSLDDNVQQQKQQLNKLEYDIQKELIMNNSQLNQLSTPAANENLDDLLQISSTLVETPETVKLKKEVNLSREQTRVQCKELHDLDLRMRQNESLLMHKETELKSLLEELYLHEIYLDSVNNAADTNQLIVAAQHQQLLQSKTATATNTKLKTLAPAATAASQPNMLSSSSTSTTSSASSSSSASLTPPIEHLINKSNISTIVSAQQKQQQHHHQQMSPSLPPPLPTSLPPATPQQNPAKGSDHHCDNDSGISSMSSENDHNRAMMMGGGAGGTTITSPYIQQQQQSVKSVMETLV